MVSDELLAEQLQSGDNQAFEELVKRYRSYVYFTVVRFFRDQDDAEDVFQEVFLAAYKNIAQFDASKASFKTWLFSVVKHCCIDTIRRSKKRPPLVDDFPDELVASADQSPDEVFDGVELKEALRRSFFNLSEEQRLCFTLKLTKGLSYEEISNIVGVPVGTVKSRVSTARKSLLKQVSHLLEDSILCDAVK